MLNESLRKKNKNFIATLEQLKPSDPIHQQFLKKCWSKFPSIRSSKPDSKQREGSSNFNSPHSDKYEEVTINEIIQDIKMKIEIVENDTGIVVKMLSEYYVSATKKKEEEQFPVVQVYERDGNTNDFVTALQERMDIRYKPDVIVDLSEIDTNKPLLILCQSRSRLIPDIDYSLELLKEVENISRLGIVIIHSKEEHALPTTSSEYKLGDGERFKNAWIIDTAFTNDLKFYDCKMNTEAILKLQKFLKGETCV